MNYTLEKKGDISIVTVELVEASLNQSDDFKAYIYSLIDNGARKMIINLEKVLYMDSSFIGALVGGLKNLLSKSGEMALVNISSDVMALFELTRLDKVFHVYDSTDDAVKSFD
jgi:anti-sigma B factor antagonist